MKSLYRLSSLLPLFYLRCVRRQFVLIRLYAHMMTNGRDTKCLQVSLNLPGEENWPIDDHHHNNNFSFFFVEET